MFPDFKDLLSALNAHQVRYLVVGGYAVGFHAQPRATRDLDILISADPENGKAVHAALTQFGVPLGGLSAEDFVEPGSFYRMGSPPVMVDILSRISGVDFDEAWQRRVSVAIDETLSAPFISREDLLAAKLAAGRPQDLADVAALGAGQQHAATEQQAGSADPVLEAQRKGREEWLKVRELRGSGADPEETRARAREDWLKLREQQDRSPPGEATQERAKDRGAGIDDDSDT
ncbi:MAG TPA: nucleotidyl transferase AbiEii/AbiGii toxin family protein [Steroidobacteraceae bacterium]|nr:nucleotidyl transferase AbiEii/AbiGii toxin family protein [Steroidobacteraceae bacterium]